VELVELKLEEVVLVDEEVVVVELLVVEAVE
jgi:hypothetical protein